MRLLKQLAMLLVTAVMLGITGCADKPKEENSDGDSDQKAEVAPGFQKLELVDFNQVLDPKAGQPEKPTWRMEDDVLICSGVPRGYIRTKSPARNFTFKLEFMYPSEKPTDPKNAGKPPNTGVLVYIQSGDRVWPDCLEVQGRLDQIATIKSNKRGLEVNVNDDEEARKRALKPIGEWNTLSIVSEQGRLTSFLNDALIAESDETDLARGFIGLQSEGFEVHFRNILLKKE